MARVHETRDDRDQPRGARQRILEYHYELYRRAHDALAANAGANALLQLYAQAMGCRRAADVIEFAETQWENGFPALPMEHVGLLAGDCSDCTRSACLTLVEIAEASSALSRLSA